MKSHAFKEFKNKMGQANHFLITIIIGLDGVKNGTQKDKSFNVCWNPRDVQASANRSKEFVLKSALAWAVDSLDMYVRLCNRDPKLFQSPESEEIANTKHSIYKKIQVIISNHNELDPIKVAFVDLLICWRNNMLHYDADNKLLHSSEKIFKDNTMNNIVQKYHLNISDMLNHFYKKATPTFKEMATMFSMTIHFVEELDQSLFKNIDKNKYLEDILKKNLKDNANANCWKVFQKNNNIPVDERRKMIKQFFITNGICPIIFNDNIEAVFNKIINGDISELIKN